MKRFLDQDISGESLEEFKSEVLPGLTFTSGHLQLMFSNDTVELIQFHGYLSCLSLQMLHP